MSEQEKLESIIERVVYSVIDSQVTKINLAISRLHGVSEEQVKRQIETFGKPFKNTKAVMAAYRKVETRLERYIRLVEAMNERIGRLEERVTNLGNVWTHNQKIADKVRNAVNAHAILIDQVTAQAKRIEIKQMNAHKQQDLKKTSQQLARLVLGMED